MEINLTAAQWAYLKKVVVQGKRLEMTLSKPLEITNADVKLDIDAAGDVKITLPD